MRALSCNSRLRSAKLWDFNRSHEERLARTHRICDETARLVKSSIVGARKFLGDLKKVNGVLTSVNHQFKSIF